MVGRLGERTAKWKASKEGRESANGGEWNRIGEKSATRREGCEDATPTTTPLHPRIKNRSYLPYLNPSPRDAAQSPEH